MSAYKTPQDLRYASSHEWLRLEGDTGTVGITDYAQHSLGDIVFVELPEVGSVFSAGESFGTVESVKAASDIYLPVSGEIIEVNEALTSAPETLNSDPYEGGWLVKVRVSEENAALLDAAAYEQVVAEADH